MSDIPTKTYPPECLHAMIADHEAEQAGATSEASSAVETNGDTMSEITRFFSWDGNEFMHETANGDYVLYEDHIAQVERLRANGQGMFDSSRPSDEIARGNLRVDEEAETDRIAAERNAARAEVERLEAEVDRLTSERDTARAEVRRLIAERDQPESRPKGREVGRFGWDGHYLDYEAMKPTRPSDEDIWREAFMRSFDYIQPGLRISTADKLLAEYRKRWPR